MTTGDTPFALGSVRTTASHTIGIPHLVELLAAVPSDAPSARYREAIVDDNVLGRPTHTGRQRSYRHLRELYRLDPARPEFAALRRVWGRNSTDEALIAGMLAFSQDEVLRASFPPVRDAAVGDVVTSADLTAAVTDVYGGELSDSTLGKIGRNTGACWSQIGLLLGRTAKIKQNVRPGSTAIAFAGYLGHLSGLRGLAVLDGPWAALLSIPRGAELEALRSAHSDRLVDLLVAGDVVEVGFPFFTEAAR